MPLTINTNTAATDAAANLQTSNALMQKSLNRLSSGSRITSPADDAGGLAVSMKLSASIRRTEAVNVNLSNAISFLQTQDGAMSTADQILSRISELKVLSEDVTKSASDKLNYQAEFGQLQAQLASLSTEKFNGVNMFSAGGTTISVITTEDGSNPVDLTLGDLSANTATITAGATTLSSLAISDVTTAIQALATQRAQNGAESNRLSFASQMLTVNKSNLEAANSRIIDTDVAFESTQLARYNILVQAGTAMLAQANNAPQIALRLLNN